MTASHTRQVAEFLEKGRDWVSGLTAANATRFSSEDLDRLSSMASKIPVTQFIVGALGSLMDALSNLALVLLFAVYLLLGSEPKHAATSRTDDAVTKLIGPSVGRTLLPTASG